ncbi:hypothetical protein B0T26DRAFT_98232 [Lasiosphaeria miniovina]|uniref:Uncharacterized protein n=1 Tax=Lasiosphaeria miniovina TaxID=1954250 RepID=A0AA40BJD1_9PEZI|nr:uncharacterized protein B0T26DRAFT_98232 [Lasiosphaeria miniovina]KAK0735203.1 hypothetical protein B0T26DRAFT_98232 [Lasiosphaeria miniovina]
MAIFDPIDFFSIADGRDIVIVHETARRRRGSSPSSVVSFSSVYVDEECVTRPPWFSSRNPLTPFAGPGLPSPSVSAQPVPEELDAQLATAVDGPFTATLGALAVANRTSIPITIAPLDRFTRNAERHEEIAFSMAVGVRCALPYQDYLPCPGSGPGSVAVSTSTENIAPFINHNNLATEPAFLVRPDNVLVLVPGHVVLAPTQTQPQPQPQTQTQTLDQHQTDSPSPPATTDRSPMSRYLAVEQHHEWLAVVLEQQPQTFSHQLQQLGSQEPDLPQHMGAAPDQPKTPLSSISLNGTRTTHSDPADPPEALPTSERRQSHDQQGSEIAVDMDCDCDNACSYDPGVVKKSIDMRRAENVPGETVPRSHRLPRQRPRQNQKTSESSPARKRARADHYRGTQGEESSFHVPPWDTSEERPELSF